eukprot:1157289-Pelagomonas_calceolata.AAC.8
MRMSEAHKHVMMQVGAQMRMCSKHCKREGAALAILFRIQHLQSSKSSECCKPVQQYLTSSQSSKMREQSEGAQNTAG